MNNDKILEQSTRNFALGTVLTIGFWLASSWASEDNKNGLSLAFLLASAATGFYATKEFRIGSEVISSDRRDYLSEQEDIEVARIIDWMESPYLKQETLDEMEPDHFDVI